MIFSELISSNPAVEAIFTNFKNKAIVEVGDGMLLLGISRRATISIFKSIADTKAAIYKVGRGSKNTRIIWSASVISEQSKKLDYHTIDIPSDYHTNDKPFFKNAQEVVSQIYRNTSAATITLKKLSELVKGIFGTSINLYPGTEGTACFNTAVFISIKAKGKQGHISHRNAIQTFIQHNSSCQSKNNIIITDHFDSQAFREWAGTIRRITSTVNLEMYLITGSKLTAIEI